MASIFKVVAVWARWSVFQVVDMLGANLGQQDCQLSWPIMFCGRRPAALIFGGGRWSADGGEAVLLATGASTMGASAVWLSVEVMAMALVGSACRGFRRGATALLPLRLRWISFSRSISSRTQTL